MDQNKSDVERDAKQQISEFSLKVGAQTTDGMYSSGVVGGALFGSTTQCFC